MIQSREKYLFLLMVGTFMAKSGFSSLQRKEKGFGLESNSKRR
tara:strand:+ start:2195 stop:2323 length:129 start_codon:yes stop_codon:yes gene_type:complete